MGSLRYLFADMNAFFASVEQQLQPELRGKPVGVVPVMAGTTCCIACSYEARKFGVRTGTAVHEAMRLCPGIQLTVARPSEYVKVHNRIIEVLESCAPVHTVCSIDEAACRLIGTECERDNAMTIAKRFKQRMRDQIGLYVRCSVGLAPNHFLAKVATEIEKPNGLVAIEQHQLPDALYGLELGDLPGIGRRMEVRLRAKGVNTVEQLCNLTMEQMAGIWQSVVGRIWWHWLRGYDLPEPKTQRCTVGHSHVLAPKYRNPDGARAVMVRLIHKAARRLRNMDYWAQEMWLNVKMEDRTRWVRRAGFHLCQDTQTFLEEFAKLWPTCPAHHMPKHVSMTLTKLVPPTSASPPLFEADQTRLRLAQTMDRIERRFGNQSVYFGSMAEALDSAPMRISFARIPDVELEE